MMAQRADISCGKTQTSCNLSLDREVELIAIRPLEIEGDRKKSCRVDKPGGRQRVFVWKRRNASGQITIWIGQRSNVAELLPYSKRQGVLHSSPSVSGNTAEENTRSCANRPFP